MQDLPLQVARVHDIEVDDAESADAGGGKIHGGGRAEPAGPHAHDPGGLEAALAVDADIGQDDVPGVAGQLFAGEIGKRAHDRDSLQ